MTGSQSGICQPVLRRPHSRLDVAVHLDHRHPVLERGREHAYEPELALTRLERQLDVAHEHRTRAVEHPRARAEDPFDRWDEIGRWILESHRSRSGTVSKPIACSSACPTRKSRFSANCGPIS